MTVMHGTTNRYRFRTELPSTVRPHGRLLGILRRRNSESGRIGYLVLYLLGTPIGVLILLWVLLGDNIFGAG
jgi:hypothetical protein